MRLPSRRRDRRRTGLVGQQAERAAGRVGAGRAIRTQLQVLLCKTRDIGRGERDGPYASPKPSGSGHVHPGDAPGAFAQWPLSTSPQYSHALYRLVSCMVTFANTAPSR